MTESYGSKVATGTGLGSIGNYDWGGTFGGSYDVFGKDPSYWYTSDIKLDLPSLLGGGKTSFMDSLVGGLGKGLTSGGITRLAGAVGSLFGGGGGANIEEAIKKINELAKSTTGDIDQRIANIYPGLTGRTADIAIQEAYDRFGATTRDVQARGRADLGVSPDIADEYDRLGSRIDQIQNQYSLANRLGGYEKIALDPPVVSMDVNAIKSSADWVDPNTNQVKAEYKALYDYSDPQTKQFLYGNRATADAIGRYYGNSGDVAGLMNYGSVV